eukprot:g60574.t1
MLGQPLLFGLLQRCWDRRRGNQACVTLVGFMLTRHGHTESSFRRKFDIHDQLPADLHRHSSSRKVMTKIFEDRARNVHFEVKRDLLSFKGHYTVAAMGLPWEVDRLACWDSPDVKVHLKCDNDNNTYANSHHSDDTYADGHHSDFDNLILRSKFCFAPGGGGALTGRFSETLLLGCVPLVTDDLILPFEGYLDWSAAVLSFPVKNLPTVPVALAEKERAHPDNIARMQKIGSKYVDTCFLTPSHELMCVLATVKKNIDCSSATRQGGAEAGVGQVQSPVTTQSPFLTMPDTASWKLEWGTIRPIYTGPPSTAPCPGIDFQPAQPGVHAAKLRWAGYQYSTRWGNVLSPYWMRRSVAYMGGCQLRRTLQCSARNGCNSCLPLTRRPLPWTLAYWRKLVAATGGGIGNLDMSHGVARYRNLDVLPKDTPFRLIYVIEPDGVFKISLTHAQLRVNALRVLISLLEEANLTEHNDTIAKVYQGNMTPPLNVNAGEQLMVSNKGDKGPNDASLCSVYQLVRDLWMTKNRPQVTIERIERTVLTNDFTLGLCAQCDCALGGGSSWLDYSLLANTGNVYMVSTQLSEAVRNNHTLPANLHVLERENPEVKGIWAFNPDNMTEMLAMDFRSLAQFLKWLAS